MTLDPAPPSQRAAVRAQRRERRAARIARRETFFDLVASGYSCRQIAEAAKVSAATVRREIDRAIAERRLDAPERYVHVQVARLTKALRLADAAIERGELKAVRPLVRLVAALDRYHGLGRRARNERRPPRVRPCPRRRPRPSPCRLRPWRSPTPRRRSTASRRSPMISWSSSLMAIPERARTCLLPGPVRFIAVRAARENCELPTGRRAIRPGGASA